MNKLWIAALVVGCFLLGASCQMVFDEQTGDNEPSWKRLAQGAQAQNDSLFLLNVRLSALNHHLSAENDTLFVRLEMSLLAERHWRKLAMSKERWPDGRALERERDFDPGGILWLAPWPADTLMTLPL